MTWTTPSTNIYGAVSLQNLYMRRPMNFKPPATIPRVPCVSLFKSPFAFVLKYRKLTSKPPMKKNVSTLKTPFVIVWKRNFFSTTFRYSMLSEYLNVVIQVWPKITQAIDITLRPWTVLIVSPPTLLSQITLTLARTEKESNNSSKTPRNNRGLVIIFLSFSNYY